MRWLAFCVLLSGCLRARATAVHPESYRTVSGGSRGSIAREDPPSSEVPEGSGGNTLGSLELGAVVPFHLATANVHIAPGVRVFGGETKSVLFGVAVGADFIGNGRGTGFALEGSIHAGDSSSDLTVIEDALDVFAGVTLHRPQGSIAIGPSFGVLGLPGGQSVMMVGLGLRVMGEARH